MNIFIAIISNQQALLPPGESWHCAKVLRLKTGEKISIIDGFGNFYEGILTQVNAKNCTANLTAGPTKQKQKNYRLHIAMAPTKNIERIEWFVEKAVELGIDEISFIRCKNSERVAIKTERVKKIVESAVKQSLQAYLPVVNDISDFGKIISLKADQKLIAHCHSGIKKTLTETGYPKKDSLILIGPEGDFTSDEVNLALKSNFEAVSFGETRLRTETAGLYACLAASFLAQ